MTTQTWWSDKLDVEDLIKPFTLFVQGDANRLMQGHARYGHPNKRKKYLTRLKLELDAYIKTGNIEHLHNLRNYAFLEFLAPEHKNSHFDSRVDSATRGKV